MATESTATQKVAGSEFWARLHESPGLALHAAIYTSMAERIAPGCVLDLGCEYGLGSLLLAETNPRLRVAGVDVDLPGLRYSQKTLHDAGRLERVNADARGLPVDSGSVSGVYLINLLHLLPEPARILSEVCRVLTPDGVAIISVPRGDPLASGPHGANFMQQLAAQTQALFADVEFPVEILGQLPSFPAQSFRLDGPNSPWIARCQKKKPTL